MRPQDSPVADEAEVEKECHEVDIVWEQTKTQSHSLHEVFKLEKFNQSHSLRFQIHVE